MSHSLQNPKSLASLERKLRSIFDIEIQGGVPWISTEQLDPFISEASKSVGNWITDDDIRRLVVTAYINKCPSALFETGRLFEVTPKVEVDAAIEYVLEELAGLPRTYAISFPAPRMRRRPGVSDIRLDDYICICSELELKTSDLLLPTKQNYIQIKATGYAHNDRYQTAMREATSRLKVMCHAAHMSGLFVARPASLGLREFGIGLQSQRNEQAYLAVVHSAEKYNGMAPLGGSLSKYLDTVTIADNYSADRIVELANKTRQLLRVLYLPETQKDVQSLRRAIEWAFDARIDEDETTRFLKTCIGLEAALTEQNEEMGVTQQLADRCAFLLNRTTSAREETRKEMKAIYRLRSKIVHGAVDGLSPKETHLSESATQMLTRIVDTELKGVLSSIDE